MEIECILNVFHNLKKKNHLNQNKGIMLKVGDQIISKMYRSRKCVICMTWIHCVLINNRKYESMKVWVVWHTLACFAFNIWSYKFERITLARILTNITKISIKYEGDVCILGYWMLEDAKKQ